MIKHLILTHGRFAEGILDTLKLFIGEENNFTSISAYSTGIDVDSEISDYFKNVSADDQVIIYTDILGGSVNQKVVPYISENVHIIAGVNLGILIQASTISEGTVIDDELMRQLVNVGQDNVVYVNDYMKNISFNEEDE